MAKKETILVGLAKEKAHAPGFAVCYARGTFVKQGRMHRVERGKRTVVSRALCVVQYHGRKCRLCPHSEFTAQFEGVG